MLMLNGAMSEDAMTGSMPDSCLGPLHCPCLCVNRNMSPSNPPATTLPSSRNAATCTTPQMHEALLYTANAVPDWSARLTGLMGDLKLK